MAQSGSLSGVPMADDISTDGGSTTGRQPRTKARRKKRLDKQNSAVGDERRGSKGGSVMWTILLVGLLFSLADVFYMIWLVDRNDGIVSNTSSLVSHTVINPVLEKSVDDADKEPVLDIVRRAGIEEELDKETIDALPTWSEVVRLYGPKPIIHGLDRCEEFQENTKKEGFVGAAGTFNSGTNLMAELLIANCHMQSRMNKYGAKNRGIRWQVPWGKHTPPGDDEFRRNHKTYHDADIGADAILPAVTIRDPLTWLISMCHHHYTANWHHTEEHCPDFSLPNLKTHVSYAEFSRKHSSILHLWNDYYQEYLKVSFPRLLVRIEDLIFHPEEVTKTVCECAGGSMRNDGKFVYVLNSAKKGEAAHGKDRTGFVDAMIKYGSETKRYSSYKSSLDLEYIRDNVDPELMRLMGYKEPDPNEVPTGAVGVAKSLH